MPSRLSLWRIGHVWSIPGEWVALMHRSAPRQWHVCYDSLCQSLLRFRAGTGRPPPVGSCWCQCWRAPLPCPVTCTGTRSELSSSSPSTWAACWRRAVSICLMVRNALCANGSLLACSWHKGAPLPASLRERSWFCRSAAPQEGGAGGSCAGRLIVGSRKHQHTGRVVSPVVLTLCPFRPISSSCCVWQTLVSVLLIDPQLLCICILHLFILPLPKIGLSPLPSFFCCCYGYFNGYSVCTWD